MARRRDRDLRPLAASRAAPRGRAVGLSRRVAAGLAVAVAALALAASAGGTDFKVLNVVATGWGIDVSNTQVGATLYTVRFHDIGQYTAHFTVSAPGTPTVHVRVGPNNWAFSRIRFKPGATYTLKVTSQPGPTTYAASLPVQ